ncbi:MAG: LrgB family protein [Eubacteriales bacterium]
MHNLLLERKNEIRLPDDEKVMGIEMNLNELVTESLYFGMTLSLIAYWIGLQLQKKLKHPLVNPLLISIILIILFLLGTGVEYEVYQYGADKLTYFLTPVTVCLAVPLYKQMQVLKDNLVAVLISIGLGCIAHAAVIIGFLSLFSTERTLVASLLPKSITTAIALGVSGEIGGIQGVTVIGVCIAGLSGAIVGPLVMNVFKITEPVAQGLAMGSAAHAIGTSKAIEIGEVQAAMSSLAIVVTGLITVIIVPIIANYI